MYPRKTILEDTLFTTLENSKMPSQEKEKAIEAILEAMRTFSDLVKKRYADEIDLIKKLQQQINLNLTEEQIIPEIPSVNEKRNYKTPLMIAAKNGEPIEILRMLVKAGANVDLQDRSGNTALISAAENGHLHSVNYLLSINAKSLIKNRTWGIDAFMAAILEGHAACAERLKSECASLHTYKKMATKEIKAVLLRSNNPEEKKRSAQIIQCLIKFADADPNAPCPESYYPEHTTTPLIFATSINNAPAVKVLIEANANVNARNTKYKASALDFAIVRGHLDCIELLYNAGAREPQVIENIISEPKNYASPIETIAKLLSLGEPITNISKFKKFLKTQDQTDEDVIFCKNAILQFKQAPSSSRTWASYFYSGDNQALQYRKLERGESKQEVALLPVDENNERSMNL